MTTSSMQRIRPALGSSFRLTQRVMWGFTLQSPSIPTMHSTFPTTMIPMTTSSMPPVQAAAQPQAIGTMSPLTQQELWGITLQSPLIPTMPCTFPTTMIPMTTSSMPPVQAAAQPRAIGTRSPLTQQVMWGVSLQSPSIPTMLSTFPTLILPITTSSMPPVQAAAQPRAIGTRSPLTQQGLWGITPQSPLIPTMHVHISYYESTNDDLKYATCSSGCTTASNWDKVSVDTTGNVGYYTSIAIDSNDAVHISYLDFTNIDLKYATCSSGCTTASNWDIVSVDTTGNVGYHTSIAIDSNDAVHISYYDSGYDDLKYMVLDSSSNIYGYSVSPDLPAGLRI